MATPFTANIPTPQLPITPCSLYGGLLENSLGNLYFVAPGQMGHNGNPGYNDLVIWESIDDGHTWTRIVTDSDRFPNGGIGVCIIGDVIYFAIVNSNVAPNSRLGIYIYNTATHVFLADDYGGPAGSSNAKYATAVALSNGTISICYGVDLHFNTPAYVVTWLGGVWSTPISLGNLVPYAPQWAIKEVTTDRVHLFCHESTGGLIGNLWHVSIEANGVVNTNQQIVTGGVLLFAANLSIGSPCIVGSDLQINIPYTIGPTGSHLNPGEEIAVHCLRATPVANPVWTDEVVTNAVDLFPNIVEPLLGLGYFCSAAIEYNGGVTIIFTVDNNPPGVAGQSWLYTCSTTVLISGWGNPTLLFTGVAGAVAENPYARLLSDGSFGVVIGTIDLATELSYTSLILTYIGVAAPNPPNPNPLPSPCEGEVRLQIYDDKLGEYVYDKRVSTLAVSGDNGVMCYLAAPISIGGLMTVEMTNVQTTKDQSVVAHLALIVAVPKRLYGE